MAATRTPERSAVWDAARLAALDGAALGARVDEVLSEELYWFPVRHHSPAVAAALDACLRERRPKIVFIEGPHEAQGMIEYLVDPDTRPPVAIYTSFRDDGAVAKGETKGAVPSQDRGTPGQGAGRLHPAPRFAAWYPLVSYSPELIALQAANDLGASAVFMDLPHFAIPYPDAPLDESAEHPAAAGKPPREAPERMRHDLEEFALRSEFYRLLTQAAGYRTWNETWDALFETPRAERGYEGLRRELSLFCAAIRATTDATTLARDGTLARERFMWRTIQSTLQARNISPREAVVVCGGFHLFLDRSDPTPPPEIPQGTVSVTVAPYSYFRISELSGYGAGNRAPRYYEMHYQNQAAAGDPTQLVIEYVTEVVKETRRRGERLSPADAIAATQHSLLLARIRGRREPILDDILDGLISCCCKGNPQTEGGSLLEAIDEINIGSKLGKVTGRLGRLPIVADFYEQLSRWELEEIVAREKICLFTLDKRQERDAGRSAFLHRLVFLGLEIGGVQRETAPLGQSIFREHWRVKWSPKLEAVLIERNLLGDAIEAAAATMLRESLGTAALEAGPACRALVQAVDMDLPQLIAEAEPMTGHAIDHDQRFHSLSEAFTSLLLLERYAAFRGLGKERIAELLARCFDRACFAVPDAACAPPEEWENVVQGLLALAEPVVQRADLDGDLFAQHVRRAAETSTMPFLRGAFLGVLAEMRQIPAAALAEELSAYARGGMEQQIVAGDFLAGVLRVSRTAILLGASELVGAVDELLRAAEGEVFLCLLPRLRAAFESLSSRQRDSLAVHVAERYGLAESQSLRTLATSAGAAQLLADLDAQAAAILAEWLDEEDGA